MFPGEGASNDSGVVENGNFQRFRYFLGNLRDEVSVIIRDTQSVVSFSAIPKCMTLNNLEWLYQVKFGFRAGLAGSDRATFEK